MKASQPRGTDREKRNIRNDVPKVRDAEYRALVGETGDSFDPAGSGTTATIRRVTLPSGRRGQQRGDTAWRRWQACLQDNTSASLTGGNRFGSF
jgi:hypothetical protein